MSGGGRDGVRQVYLAQAGEFTVVHRWSGDLIDSLPQTFHMLLYLPNLRRGRDAGLSLAFRRDISEISQTRPIVGGEF